MQVYKACFKVIQKNLMEITIYIVVFLGMAILFASTFKGPADTNFTETKLNIAFINHDAGSRLVDGLKDYLSQYTRMIDIPDDTRRLQDALFFREVEYIIRVPKGFTEGLFNGGSLRLEKTTVPGSASEVYLDNLINKYLNTAQTYIRHMKGLPEDQLLKRIDEDLSIDTQVVLYNPMGEASQEKKPEYFFNYMAYSLFAVLILGVSSIMIVFNHKDLKMRNLCTPVKLKYMNFQMILANCSYALLAWFVMISAGFILYGDYMLTERGLLFLLNSLVFTMAALSISFLIGSVIKGKGAMSAASNVVSLGTCFISGVFVPQAFLGKPVLTIASFTPSYWYVKSNNLIAEMVNFRMENLEPVFINMFIVLGFAAAALSVTLVVIKQKRMSN